MRYIIAFALSWVASAQARQIHVSPGHSIQYAIDCAVSGDQIIVRPGTYREQLLIKKSGISLIGHHAVLIPPDNLHNNSCTDFCGPGTQAGICIAGKGINADPFYTEHRKIRSVSHPVRNVLVQGFNVTGFQVGPSVLVIGGKDVHVEGNKINSGPNAIYGFLSAGSVDTILANNVITAVNDTSQFSFIGACNDNFDGTQVYGNHVAMYFIGLCIQSDGAYFHDNTVQFACAGAFIDPYVSNVRFQHNKLTDFFPACDAFGAWGVYVSGASGSRIDSNQIEDVVNLIGPSAGILITDDACTEASLGCISNGNQPSVARNNVVRRNSFSGNTLDLWQNSTGTGNTFRANRCSTSKPAGLCRK